jgi:hypothetical protein
VPMRDRLRVMPSRQGRVASGCAVIAIVAATGAGWAEGADTTRATPEQTQKAQTVFRSGDALFDVQRYEEALARYRASFDIVASPNTRLMIARCLNELGRLDEALSEYQETLALARKAAEKNPAYQPTAQAAQDELTALRSRVAWLSIDLGDVPPDAELTVGGKPARLLGEPLPVVPGKVEIVATARDGRQARAEVHLAAGRESSVKLKLGETVTVGSPPEKAETPAAPAPSLPPPVSAAATEPPPKSSGLRPLAWIAGGVGVAGLVGFGVLGALNNSKFHSLESKCPEGHCPPNLRDDIDRGRQLQTFANVSLIVGAVGLGTSVTLFLVGRDRPRQTAVLVGPSSVELRGRF